MYYFEGIRLLGSAEEKEPTVEFKDSGSRKNERPAKGAKGAKGLAPIELSLSPTLFSINLNIKRVSDSPFG